MDNSQFMSMQFCSTPYGVKNTLLTGVLRDERGQVWAVEGWMVYAKRHVCVNLKELEVLNGKEDTMVMISYALMKGF